MHKRTLRISKYILIISTLCIALNTFIQHQLLMRYKNDQVLSVHLQTSSIRSNLEKLISSNMLIIQGLANYISVTPTLSSHDFDLYAQEMLHNSDLIRNIGAAPDYRISFVYPLKGNEAVLGLDYHNSPEQWELCKLAETSGQLVVAGPVNLIQGGKGFIGRAPVFIRKDGATDFWGIVSAVIDTDQLFVTAGVNSIEGLDVAIRGINLNGEMEDILLGNPELFNPDEEAVKITTTFFSKSLLIAARPSAGWDNHPPNSTPVHIFMLLLALGASFTAFKIISQTAEVERVRTNLSEAQTVASLGNWSQELKSGKIWLSSEAYRIFGIPVNTRIKSKKELFNLIHPDDREFVRNNYVYAKENRKPYKLDHRLVRPDGEVRYISEQGRFDYNEHGNPIRSYGTIHDITERKLIEKELLETKVRFDHVTNKLSNKFIFFSHTIYGNFINLSKGFEILGLGPAENGLGRRWTDIINVKPDSLAHAMEQNEKIISGEQETAEYEISYINIEGKECYLAVFGFMTFDHDRSDYVFEGVAIDITERKEREEKLKVLTRAIENAPISVVITDTEGTIKYVNPYFSIETGYSKEESIGENPRVLKSNKHDEEFYKNMWDTITSGETWRGELINKRKDGSLYWESASISPVYNEKGKIVSYVAVKEDISDKKELERLKADVDLIMRHDLKTPLNGIIGLPGLLLLDDNLTESQRELIKIIEESGHNMLRMIDMSLDMFKMETGKYEYTPSQIDVVSIARKVISQSHSRISAKSSKVELVVNGEAAGEDSVMYVYGEERLFYSLLSGLLTNAIEASPHNETVCIRFNEKTPVSVAICNKGVVPHDIRESFFQKYVTAGKTSGTGLGTYSAKLMADTMSYDLKMETFDLQGETCLTIYIPRMTAT